MLLGVDTGGTFTDFVFFDGERLRIHKVLSTPRAPERAIAQGASDLGIDHKGLRVVHGSTVATNAVLEGKGARTVFVTNRGLGDVLTIGRQARRELYNLQPAPVPPPVPPELCLETGGRLGADGRVVDPLLDMDIERLIDEVRAASPQAVAISLLFSFVDGRFEEMIEAALSKELFVARSSSVLPEYREYERGITTWLNAYVGPLMQGYLSRLGDQLAPASLAVMQSSGGTCSADQGGRLAVNLLLSGPAGGLRGAEFVARTAGYSRMMTLDMGGTSTDVALIDDDIGLTTEGGIGPYPVAVPMVDMHTIGAGGGSIASVDAGGALLVGPASAGADPGPACYGAGGTLPTVTDANLVLGRIPAGARLGGAMPLDLEAARQAIGELARRLGGYGVEEAAEGVVRLANEHMAAALRVISVQRGLDPREFVLVSFGGAGGLHVCDLADALGVREALVPVHAGVLSALGMLVAPRTRQLARTFAGVLEDVSERRIEEVLDELAAEGESALAAEGVSPGEITRVPSLDLCYRGQSYTLNVPWQDHRQAAEAFHRAHEQRYGHRLEVPVALVNVRLGLAAGAAPVTLPELGPDAAPVQPERRAVHGVDAAAEVWQREALRPAQLIEGPAIICEAVSTTYVAPGWQCRVDGYGNLCLSGQSSGRA